MMARGAPRDEHAEAHRSHAGRAEQVRRQRPPLLAVRRALAVWRTLDIKQIQLDTLSHLILHDLSRYALWKEADKLASALLGFHLDYSKEGC